MNERKVRKGATIRYQSSWDTTDVGTVVMRAGRQVYMEGGKHCIIEEVLEILD